MVLPSQLTVAPKLLVKNATTAAAAIAALSIVLRYILSLKAKKTLITDFQLVGRRVTGRVYDYDPDEYDVVIIGGGTAGCVLAARLSEDPKIRVLMLEAGGSSKQVVYSRLPAGFTKLFGGEHDWNFFTTPQKDAGGIARRWPRAKLLGGCSAINAMIYHYGAPSDYDEWAEYQKGQEGAEGWKYNEFHKYFMKYEKYTPDKRFPLVDHKLRGSSGPVQVGYYGYFSDGSKKFLKACAQVGVPHSHDINTHKGTLGVTKAMTYIGPDGRRVTTESSYLTPEVLARPNLKVATNATVTKIRFETREIDGVKTPRAVAVEFVNPKGEKFKVKVRKEAIVAAGALHTPQVLMLSGVGPADHLAEHKIPLVADLPGVGQHLMDHLVLDLGFKTKDKLSLSYLLDQGFSARLRVMSNLWQFRTSGTGPLTSNLAETIGFVRSTDPKLFPPEQYPPEEILKDMTSAPDAPDLEIFYSPLAWGPCGSGKIPHDLSFGLHVVLLRPISTGTVRLKSANYKDLPICDPQYLSHEQDVKTFVRGARLLSRIAHAEPLASTLDPSGNKSSFYNNNLDTLSDEEVAKIIRNTAQTLYHPTSTARMAPLADGGVVDPYLRVHGIPNLRVVDASVFPTIVSGHTAAPVIAIAEKAADLIKAACRKN